LQRQKFSAGILLFLVAATWGLTFSVIKTALPEVGPMTFNAVRFQAAAALLFLFTLPGSHNYSLNLIKAGSLAGVFLFLGYGLQTLGLTTTTATNAGFITGLSIVLVPLGESFIYRRLPQRPALLGVLLATAGLGLLTIHGPGGLNRGDLLVLGCAAAFAAHVLTVDRFAKSYPTGPLVTVQITVVALFSSLAAWLMEGWQLTFSPAVQQALLVTVVPATVAAYFIQNWAQRRISATGTALILALEPAFAALFAYFLLADPLSSRIVAGSLLMLAGILLAEFSAKTLN